ncbi:MAG: HypC/HybG/HupF family hydrogenase formation chaperone [Candidatus Pacebacteria bacterium]|nr:HypC/HybG/HupF family hydrogenase formation chaperone [Candidatus Paceibacterota bacterium]
MCLAIPGKIKSVDKKNNTAVVDFSGIERDINVSLVDVKKNDFVIVHAGFAIEKLTSKDAKEVFDLINGK